MSSLLVDLGTSSARLRLDCSLHGPENLPPFFIGASGTSVRQVAVSLAACALATLEPSHRRIREVLGIITSEIVGALKPATTAERPIVALAAYIDTAGAQFGGLVPMLEAAARLELPETDPSCHWWGGSGLKLCEDGLFRPDSHPSAGKVLPGGARDALVAHNGATWEYVMALQSPRHEPGAAERILSAVVHVGLAGCVPSCEVHALRMSSLLLRSTPRHAQPFSVAMWYRDAARAMLDCLRDDAAAAAAAIRKLAELA
jgi:hypothetical protein